MLRERLVLKDRKEKLVLPVHKVLRALKEKPVLRGHRVKQVRPAQKVKLVTVLIILKKLAPVEKLIHILSILQTELHLLFP